LNAPAPKRRRISPWLRRIGVAVLPALLLGACSKPPPNRPIEPVYDPHTGRLQLLKYDSNQNGRADTVAYMDGPRILRIEIDQNEDGTVDRWEYYDAAQKLTKVGFSRLADGKEDAWSYPAADGSSARIDISTQRDGRVTRTEYYAGDAIVRAEEDSDEDGAIDKWETYQPGEGSRLASLTLDTQHRGRPDRRLVYEVGGGARLEVDPDGDGTFVRP
jgi:hypothetical protein